MPYDKKPDYIGIYSIAVAAVAVLAVAGTLIYQWGVSDATPPSGSCHAYADKCVGIHGSPQFGLEEGHKWHPICWVTSNDGHEVLVKEY
jgi:hypothetical protein